MGLSWGERVGVPSRVGRRREVDVQRKRRLAFTGALEARVQAREREPIRAGGSYTSPTAGL